MQDPMLSPEVLRRWQRLYPHVATYEIEDASHFLQLGEMLSDAYGGVCPVYGDYSGGAAGVRIALCLSRSIH